MYILGPTGYPVNFSGPNRRRCISPDGFGHRLEDWSLSDWMTATMGELGEAANVAKKLNRYRDGIQGNVATIEALRRQLRHEIADTFVYLDLMAQSQSIDLDRAVAEVFDAKSEQIGYPERIG